LINHKTQVPAAGLVDVRDGDIIWEMAAIVTIDETGRLVVPQALRRQLGLVPGTQLRVELVGDRLVLEPQRPDPALREVGGLLILEGTPNDEVPDHRDLRAERTAKLTR
jgi:AbrB family looped-hinge helix DNA binding protein